MSMNTTRRGIPSPSSKRKPSPQDLELIRRRQRFALSKSKLSRIIEIAAFMGGFSITAVAELQIPDEPNELLLTAFTITTTLLVSACGFVILFTACILPTIRANEELDYTLIETQLIKYYTSHRLFAMDKYTRYMIQISWILASVGSVFLFTLDVILVFWIKFSHYKVATASATVILSPVLLILICFGYFFRKKLVKNQLFESSPEDDDDDDETFVDENARYMNILPERRPSNAISMYNGQIQSSSVNNV